MKAMSKRDVREAIKLSKLKKEVVPLCNQEEIYPIDDKTFLVLTPNDEFLHSNNILYGGIAHDLVWGFTYILVDSFTLSLPIEVLQFIIWHEMGHIMNEDPVESMFSLEGRTLDREYKADEYAADILGKEKVIGIMKMLMKPMTFAPKIEMWCRISNLKKIQTERLENNKVEIMKSITDIVIL